MKFTFDHFGFIDHGELELGDLTIICGPNNSGKTYISYAIFGFYKFFFRLLDLSIDKETIQTIIKQGSVDINLSNFLKNIDRHFQSASESFTDTLKDYFSTDEDYFEKSKIGVRSNEKKYNLEKPLKEEVQIGNQKHPTSIVLYKEANADLLSIALVSTSKKRIINEDLIKYILGLTISKYFSENILEDPFIMTSERTGISLFYKLLDINKNMLLEMISEKDNIEPFELLNSMRSRYAQPIKRNIDTVRDFENIIKEKSYFAKSKSEYKYIFDSLQKLTGGKFSSSDKQLMFQPKKERNRAVVSVPVYISSSSVKSLFLLDLFINNIASGNDFLLIDEPELNLHPDNQRKMADLIAKLINSGVKILITTHSDYIIRELNNRVMLNYSNKREELLKELKLTEHDILSINQIKAYTVCEHKINPVKTDKYGMDMKMFDNVINQSNKVFDKIFFSVPENERIS